MLYESDLQTCDLVGILVFAGAAVMFFVQLYYYAVVYGRIPTFRTHSRRQKSESVSISVVLVIQNPDFDYLENGLPSLLEQQYDDFEVVIVDLSGNEEFSEFLETKSAADRRLVVTHMARNPRFPISNKMALNLGIKAARNEYVIITTTDCRPVGNRWLAIMAKGFVEADVVLGYCGVEQLPGFENRMMRLSRMCTSVRWISAAMRGHAYRGTIYNMGFSKRAYFDHNGFNYLNLNIGEDDLFISRIAADEKVGVVVNPHCVVRQHPWGGLDWWFKERKYYSSAYRFYPCRARRFVEMELWSRFFFFGLFVAALAVSPFVMKMVAVGMCLLRFCVVAFEMWRIGKRFAEKNWFACLPLYDLCAPFYEAWLAMSRRFNPPADLWR